MEAHEGTATSSMRWRRTPTRARSAQTESPGRAPSPRQSHATGAAGPPEHTHGARVRSHQGMGRPGHRPGAPRALTPGTGQCGPVYFHCSHAVSPTRAEVNPRTQPQGPGPPTATPPRPTCQPLSFAKVTAKFILESARFLAAYCVLKATTPT